MVELLTLVVLGLLYWAGYYVARAAFDFPAETWLGKWVMFPFWGMLVAAFVLTIIFGIGYGVYLGIGAIV